MNIQKRVYKYNDQKAKIHNLITRIPDDLNVIGWWVDENNFILKRKGSFNLFTVEGNIAEAEEKNKVIIYITTDYKYILLYILPIGLALLGAYKWFKGSEKGMFLAFAGISLSLFIFLATSYSIVYLKKNFKDVFNIL